VAANLQRLRKVRGLTIYSLSEALATVDRPITPSGIAKIERLERHVTVDDLVALSVTLNVAPQRLLEPATGCVTCSGAPPVGFACKECGADA
jgi:transcriptional regulator with XRE-family HTH domain